MVLQGSNKQPPSIMTCCICCTKITLLDIERLEYVKKDDTSNFKDVTYESVLNVQLLTLIKIVSAHINVKNMQSFIGKTCHNSQEVSTAVMANSVNSPIEDCKMSMNSFQVTF